MSLRSARKPTVLLFDIDGTLVRTGGAGRRAFNAAVGEVLGRSDACDGIGFGGMTDRAIAREAMLAVGIEPREATIDAVLSAYLARLPGELDRDSEFRVLPGVGELLARLAPSPSLALGLGTGNVREGAHLKLVRAGLGGWFDFGGFGCDHENRAELLRIGARRGAVRLGVALDECRVVVVGDTHRDVDAARAIGADCIGVGTGGREPKALVRAGATAAFHDLTDPGILESILA